MRRRRPLNQRRWKPIHVNSVTILHEFQQPIRFETVVTYEHRRTGRVRQIVLPGQWPLHAFANQYVTAEEAAAQAPDLATENNETSDAA